jgi:hypothetical protein
MREYLIVCWHSDEMFILAYNSRYCFNYYYFSHGDGHIFNLNRIDMYNPNLYQMECDSGDLGDPLLISIIRNGSARDGLNVDRRGGTYSGGDCNPENRDKTWSSNMF